jgi:hypothetical protein
VLGTASKYAGNGLVYVLAGLQAKDMVLYSMQDKAMIVYGPLGQTNHPGPGINTQIYIAQEINPYIATSWYISPDSLIRGCNGTGLTSDLCGNSLPVGVMKPIILTGGMAGDTIPRGANPEFGLSGHRVLMTWSYMRRDGGFTVWHNNEVVEPGSVRDYFEISATDAGIMMVPYHAELQTTNCNGLCITQAHGGELVELIEGSLPRNVDLCPDNPDPVVDPCWRP